MFNVSLKAVEIFRPNLLVFQEHACSIVFESRMGTKLVRNLDKCKEKKLNK